MYKQMPFNIQHLGKRVDLYGKIFGAQRHEKFIQ